MVKKLKHSKLLVISLVMVIVSMVGASFFQTSMNKVTVKEMNWETASGHNLSATLFLPKNATVDTPAPAIITSHGWYNSKEMQDLNNIEYSRRGYVVVSIDMYGHGNSDVVSPEEWPVNGTGMYDAVKLVAALPYVNKEKIGVTGHSNGARAANWSIDTDNAAEEPLIASVLLVANDAIYKKPETEDYFNNYGNRDVGIVAAQYDEFFFRTPLPDGSFTAPRDYIKTDNAQSFLNFGHEPNEQSEKRESYQVYNEEIDGKKAMRVIYNPAQIHPWNHFSKNVVESSVGFFEESLGAPNKVVATSQIWQYKSVFNLIGLIGFALFIVGFSRVLLEAKFFAALKSTREQRETSSPNKTELGLFIGGTLLTAFVSGYAYLKLFLPLVLNKPAFFSQSPTYYIGVWSAILGLFLLLLTFVLYKAYFKKNGMNLKERGMALTREQLVKTVLFAAIVVTCSFSLVFISDYFFQTDFRFWIVAVKAFTPDKIGIAFRYVLFFITFYVANAISINVFNDLKLVKKEKLNNLLLAILNGLGPIVIVTLQYVTFFATGQVFFKNVSTIVGIWLIPIVVFMIVSAAISKKIYQMTNNPYLAGLINALVITMISVSTTLTQL